MITNLKTMNPFRSFSLLFLCISLGAMTSNYAFAEEKIESFQEVEFFKSDKIVIRLTQEGLVYLNDKQIALAFLAEEITKLQRELPSDSPDTYTATIIVMEGVSKKLVEEVKTQLKQTKINIINLQKNMEVTKETLIISKEKIAVYDSLVHHWKSQPKEERVIKAKDVNLVEFIYNNMSFDQRIHAEKLPDFLPFVTETIFQKDITKQLLDKWSFSTNYQVLIDDVKVSNDTLKMMSPATFKRYYETDIKQDSLTKVQINLYTNAYYKTNTGR